MRRSLWVPAGVAALLLAMATIYRPPYVILAPGPAIDVTEDVTIEGAPSGKPDERYLAVTVTLKRPSAVRAALSRLNSEVRMVPEAQLIPPGVSEEEYARHQRMLFQESQMAAAAAAARANGMEVALDGRGARVFDILEGSPAEGRLRVGDVIKEIDGAPIRLATDLTAITTARPPGTRFAVTIERAGRARSVQVPSARLRGFNAAGTGIGVRTTTHGLEAQLPFQIRFKPRTLGGPSAGLAYALAIADMLDGASAGSERRIAVTGAIYPDGGVGSVGGIPEKERVAAEAGADLFLFPRSEVRSAVGRPPARGVDTLDDALAAIRAS